MNNYENLSFQVKNWFYDKLNKEHGCDQINSWLAIYTVERETEKAYLTNWKKIEWTDEGDEIVTPLKIWIPKSCVSNVMEIARW